MRSGSIEQLYYWTSRRWVLQLLFFWAVAEGAFFFVMADLLMIPLVLLHPGARWRLATACLLGALLGSLVPWFVGQLAPSMGLHIMTSVAWLSPDRITRSANMLSRMGLFALFAQPFSLLPLKSFMFVSSQIRMPMVPVFICAAIGRAARDFALAYLASLAGQRYRGQIAQNWAVIFAAWFCIGLGLIILTQVL